MILALILTPTVRARLGNKPGVYNYLRPGGVNTYHRPDGTSVYKRP